MSGTTHPVTPPDIPGDRNFQLLQSENLKTCTTTAATTTTTTITNGFKIYLELVT